MDPLTLVLSIAAFLWWSNVMYNAGVKSVLEAPEEPYDEAMFRMREEAGIGMGLPPVALEPQETRDSDGEAV